MSWTVRKFIIVGACRSYGNLSRFFIRIFAGIMFMQFGIRQVANFSFYARIFPEVFGMNSEWSLISMITIELLFSTLLIFGVCTRIAALPPLISMIVAEFYVLSHNLFEAAGDAASSHALMMGIQPGYLPLMFVGMFFFIVLAGPGRISVDYLLSLYLANKENLNELKNI